MFGSPVVQLKHRVLQQYHFPDVPESGYGQPSVFNRLSYIAPDGIRSMRVGWATLPNEETLKQFSSTDGFASGTPTVSRPPSGTQTIAVSGFDAKNTRQPWSNISIARLLVRMGFGAFWRIGQHG